MVAPIIAAQGAKALQPIGKALTGDIYTRTWMSVAGKGKDKRVVEQTVHVNPIAIGLGLLTMGGAAALVGAGMWATQRRLDYSAGADVTKILDVYGAVYKTVVVVDSPATQVFIGYDHFGVPHYETVPAVTHEEQVLVSPGRWVLSNSYGIPLARGEGFANYDRLITRHEQSRGFRFKEIARRLELPPENDVTHERQWVVYHSDIKKRLTTQQREGSMFNIDIM